MSTSNDHIVTLHKSNNINNSTKTKRNYGNKTYHRPITPIQQMIASCSGALITSVFVTPLDVVKIRLQSQNKPMARGSCFIYCNGLMDHLCICNGSNGNGNGKHHENCTVNNRLMAELPDSGRATVRPWYRTPGQFNGTMDAFVKIARNEGLGSLWSGLPPTLVMAVPATVIYFTLYDQLKYKMGYNEMDPNTKYVPMLAGSTARLFSVTTISPLELVRTKLQSEKLGYTRAFRVVRDSINDAGIGVVMRGLGPTLLRDIPFSGLYWFGYEFFKSIIISHSSSPEPRLHQSFIAGACSAMIAGILTTPFDVVKTRRQIELGEAAIRNKNQVSSTWRLLIKLHQENGLRTLFAGLAPRVIKVVPACAIMISSYEYGKTFFMDYNSRNSAS